MEPIETRLVPRAGVIAAIFHAGRLLLVRRAKPPYKGFWALPGGGIEPGEEARAAILRELAEETGLEPEIYGACGVADVILKDESGRVTAHHVLTLFAGEAQSSDLQAGGDAETVIWADSADLLHLDMVPHTARCAVEARAFLNMKMQSGEEGGRGLPLVAESLKWRP